MLQTNDPALLHEEIRRLKLIVAEQEEAIVQFKEMLKPPAWHPPMELCLTKHEARILAALYKAEGQVVSKEALFYALYHDQLDQPEIKIVDVYICKMRKKIVAYDLVVTTAWARGYYLNVEGVRILNTWGLGDNENAVEAIESTAA